MFGSHKPLLYIVAKPFVLQFSQSSTILPFINLTRNIAKTRRPLTKPVYNRKGYFQAKARYIQEIKRQNKERRELIRRQQEAQRIKTLEKKRLLIKQKQEAERIKQKRRDEETKGLDQFLIDMKKQPHEIAAQFIEKRKTKLLAEIKELEEKVKEKQSREKDCPLKPRRKVSFEDYVFDPNSDLSDFDTFDISMDNPSKRSVVLTSKHRIEN